MSSLDLVEYPLYNAELLRSKGLVVTEDPELDLAIVRYHKSDNSWKTKTFGECNREDPIVRKYRSVIYSLSTGCVIHASSQRRKSDSTIVLNSLKKENWVVTPYIDGTMISMFWNDAKNCWMISTRSKFHAAGNYMSPSPFRDLFKDAAIKTYNQVKSEPIQIQTLQEFLVEPNNIGKEYQYTFVLCHPEEKHVILAKEPQVYLVQVSKCNPFMNSDGTMSVHWKPVGYSRMVEIAKQIGALYPEEISVPEDQALGDYCRNVLGDTVPRGVMLVPSSQNPCIERIRILSNGYESALRLRGNTPSFRTNIIRVWAEDPTGDLLREYEGYFPSEVEDLHSVIRVLNESANELVLYYKNRHVRKNMEHDDLPHWSRKPIWDLHGIYLRERTPINKEIVLEYYRTKPAAFVNKVLKTREKDIKRDQERENIRDE
jgi:hypothetical protein